jgi:hypothetical protein
MAKPAHRSPSMDQLANTSRLGHYPRSSVVPEFIAGTPSIRQSSDLYTPGGSPNSRLPRFESNSSLTSNGQIVTIPRSESINPSPNSANAFWARNSGQAEVMSIVDNFPEPPRREPVASRSLSKPSSLANVYPMEREPVDDTVIAKDPTQNPQNSMLLPPSIQRLDTDFSGLTRNSFATATEGYDTDEIK